MTATRVNPEYAPKELLVSKTEKVAATIAQGQFVNLGMLNTIVSFPIGYSLVAVTPYSSSNGNCVPFIRYYDGALYLYARNFYSGQITTDVYVRCLFAKL